ncbi:unnamed protein product, partial [Sphagnum jensenii]
MLLLVPPGTSTTSSPNLINSAFAPLKLPSSGFIFSGNYSPSVIKDTIPELKASVTQAFAQNVSKKYYSLKDFFVGTVDLSKSYETP